MKEQTFNNAHFLLSNNISANGLGIAEGGVF